mmetsp:Transcript_37409/g.49175  ORF Transcript_37409/g.49175 Transcript_37409/m.49175 type:complete len:382 (-) Transcript_37409:101-1246(-)
MRETGAVGGAEVERHVLVAVVDGVALAALQVLQQVVLHDGVLLNSAGVGAGGLASDAIADGKDVLELAVLQGVAVDIDHTGGIADAGVEEELVLTGRRVDVGTDEVLLDGLTRVDVLEDGDLGVGILADGLELPAEVKLDAALLALLHGDLVGVGEVVDELVGGPVLDLGASGSSAHHLVSAEQRLVVEGVEVATFTLVGDGGGVVDVVAALVDSTIVEVALEASLVVQLVHEHVVGVGALLELSEAWHELGGVVEAGAEDESLVGKGLAVGESDLVAARVELGNLGVLDLGPGVDHSGQGTGLHLKGLDVLMEDTKVGLGLHPHHLVRDHSDLQLVSAGVLLQVLGEGAAVGATDEDKIEVSARGVNRRLLLATAGKATR